MRSRVYYLVDSDSEEKVAKFDFLGDCQSEKHKRNKKAGKKQFVCTGGWILSKIQ